MTHKWRLPIVLGFAHAVGDAISGFTVVSLGAERSLIELGSIVLLYNLVAFGLQPVAGYVTDRVVGTEKATVVGMCAMGFGLLITLVHPLIGIGCVAVGSAFFHVGAGAQASLATPGKCMGAALFTAPGVMGLALGTVAGLTSVHVISWLFVAAMLAIMALFFARNKVKHVSTHYTATTMKPISLCLITLLLIFVAARSGVWVAVSSSFFGINALLCLGVAAGLGKLFGGMAADTVGAKIVVPLSVAIALICFSIPSFACVVLGVFFLQSSTPIILTEVVKRCSRFPATTAGFVLGFAIVVGGIVMKLFFP